MSEPPFISVIVPSKSWTQDCDQCLESLIAQDYPKNCFEIIFVMDPCQERDDELAKTRISNSDPNVSILFSNIAGLPSARNLGISASRGTFVAFTDSDARPYCDWLSSLQKCANKTKASVIAGRVVTDFNKILPPIINANTNLGQQPLRASTANALYDRSALSAVGGFDEEFKLHEDYDLMLRVIAQNGDMAFCEKAVVYHELDHIGLLGLWKLSKGGEYLPLMYKRHPDWTRRWLKMKRRVHMMTLAFGFLAISLLLAMILSSTMKSPYPLIVPISAFVVYSIGYARVSIPVGQKRPFTLVLFASLATVLLSALVLIRTIYGSFKYRTFLL